MVTVNLQERYDQERDKRINIKGLSQYLDNSQGSLYALNVDPWVEGGAPVHRPVSNGANCRIVIFGAGFGGMCAAIRCLESGAAKSIDEILLVDPAGGFGGTWWWNRYPGLACDIESYVYLPLLEETGYMPTRRYAGGEEIRAYADILADKYNLRPRGLFQSSGKKLTWNKDHWDCEITIKGKGVAEENLKITADYVILASGAFTYPKLPNLPGLETYKGDMLHTARWRYDVTGGTPSANPVLSKLSNKRVAFVGTGASAIQAIPHISKYAKELYVVQRTPSAVDVRNNHDTDPEVFRSKVANKKGWQKERATNFQAFTENMPSDQLPKEDFVKDYWTEMPTISGAFGGPSKLTAEDVPKFLEQITELDAPRSERVRQRALDVVKDQETAKKLQAWYPGWCKRPTFHDEYLPSFNLPSVHLVDTDGKGMSALTENGFAVDGKEYPVDLIIWGTGYGSPLTDSLAGKAEMNVLGKSGRDMNKIFQEDGNLTLHGIFTNDFPNLFSLGLSQAGVGVNQVQRLDTQSEHIAYTICEARKKQGTDKAIIEASKEACEKWGEEILSHAYLLAGFAACTPGYFTGEGDFFRVTPEQAIKAGKGTLFGRGYTQYSQILDDWQQNGKLDGLEVSAA